ncbi:eukaryotic translation initiation factor 2D [Diorhabda carinulata]|uniref:eukaryotic translation initiation factor 2D n=1 Tax=Diorhabda carinulata TaxID=1163345 RepID=UPI0025A24A3D|nr:eukaryotic translation initiation factor 2D [Diorhabda carinulata]
MFKKPIKVKSNTQTKGTERRNFRDSIFKAFPNLTENDVNELLPKKEPLNILKVVTHNDIVLNVYTVQKRPIFFELDSKLFPTVFLLWKFPEIIYAFTTHLQVMDFITSGADLMLPGVVTPNVQTGLPKYGNICENDVVYVNLLNNIAAVAVGVASQSSGAMLLANCKGKCVIIHHFYGDHLCTLEGMPKLPLPNFGAPKWLQLNNDEDDFPALGTNEKINNKNDENRGDVEIIENESGKDLLDDMDELLMHCFLGAIKYSKDVNLPVLTSNFFKLNMLPICPSGKNLDIKKTSYKKLKPFLKKMADDGLIIVKEVKSGVETITFINKDHPKCQAFYIPPENRPKKESETESSSHTNIIESFVVTEPVTSLFEGYRKGDIIQLTEVRKFLTKYVKEHNLQNEDNNRLVNPNEVLAKICKTEHPVAWEEAIEKICSAMKNCYKVKSGNEEIQGKGKISPITLSVSVRSGNKKVTLIDNLELFGIRVTDFAKECQHGVAASTSISRPPGKKCDQLLVQGNQVLFVYNLLTDKYKVPKKYIKGLENAPKKKK